MSVRSCSSFPTLHSWQLYDWFSGLKVGTADGGHVSDKQLWLMCVSDGSSPGNEENGSNLVLIDQLRLLTGIVLPFEHVKKRL